MNTRLANYSRASGFTRTLFDNVASWSSQQSDELCMPKKVTPLARRIFDGAI